MGRIENFLIEIPYLKKERMIRIYLPSDYDVKTDKRYPVLYMHDGQNLYDHKLSYSGQSWEVLETLEKLETKENFWGVIVVGIDNDGERRLFDYSPWENADVTKAFLPEAVGGDGELYAKFVVEVLKDKIDGLYRTKADFMNTGIAGSSMGGYISAYMMVKYPHVFSKLGAFSTASWFNEPPFLQYIKDGEDLQGHRCFLSVGTRETSSEDVSMNQLYVDTTLRLQEALLKKGVEPYNQKMLINVDEPHNELSWAKHFRDFIEFIFD